MLVLLVTFGLVAGLIGGICMLVGFVWLVVLLVDIVREVRILLAFRRAWRAQAVTIAKARVIRRAA